MSSSDQSLTTKFFTKKLNCSQHGNKFAFKCGYEHCEQPYVCSAPNCIEEHFHYQNQGKLVLFKFDSTDCVKKFQQLDRVLNKETFSAEAKTLKSFIDELKFSMVSIFKDYRDLHLRKESLAVDLSKPFDNTVMNKVQETIKIGHNLRKQIELVKSKINLNMAQNMVISNQKDDGGPKSDYENLKEPKNQLIQLQSEEGNQVNGKNGQRQYEQGQVIIGKNQKSPDNKPVPIDLQNTNITQPQKSTSPLREENSPREVQTKYVPPFQRPQTKDSFQQLFENGSRTFSAEKVLNLRTLFQNSKNQKIQNHVNGKSSIQQHSPSNLQSVSLKQNLKIYERDFLMKKQLTIFLEKKLKNFSWGLCQQIHSSAMPFKSIQKFHETLQGRRNLLFIFVGDDRILGSFYPSRYPRLAEKTRNDPNSFLFISSPANLSNPHIIEFKAVPNQFHLSVSQKLYICHGNQPSYADGIRTTLRNFNDLNYCLPSVSFKYAQDDDDKSEKSAHSENKQKSINGFLKVKEFFVLQVSPGVEQENVYQID